LSLPQNSTVFELAKGYFRRFELGQPSPTAKNFPRKRQKMRFSGRICHRKTLRNVMVNLPPDQNERRDRDQILSFDELLAVVLALLGIGTILWWSTSRDQDWLGNETPLGIAAPSVIDELEAERARGDGDDRAGGLAPLALENFFGNQNPVTEPVAGPRQGGLPRLAEPRERIEPQMIQAPLISPDANKLEPTELQPEAIVPETEAETAAATAPPALDISDVPADHWAYPFIQDMYDQGLLPDFPSGQFQPDKELTRAELAALLNDAFIADPVERDPLQFEDVPAGYWATDAIDQVVERGFMSGYPDNEFAPDQLVPRYQVLVSLASGLDLAPPDNPEQLLQNLGDLSALPDWARGQVAAAAQQRLVVNYPEPQQLKPTETATRAEIVAMMHQALVAEGKLDPIQSEYIVAP
jgi:hypothetical protein